MAGHSVGNIVLIVVTIVVYVALLVISALASLPAGVDIGLYNNKTGDISDKFYIPIAPASWTFSIWGFVYAWQAVWMIYVVTTIFRTDSNGVYIYQLPLLPPAFFVFFIFNNIFTTAWLIVWDRQWVEWACLVIAFTPVTLFICLFLSFWKLYTNLQSLRTAGLSKEIWFIRVFVQNGIAFFATWVSIATLLNFAITLTYVWSVNIRTACIVALSVLSADVGVWFILEMFVLDKFVRYTFSPYIVLILALVGSLDKNYDLEKNYTTSIHTAVLLVVASTLTFVKICTLIYRHIRYPIMGIANDDIKGNVI